MMTANDYLGLYQSSELTKDVSKVKTLDYVCRVALTNQILYQAVSVKTGVPWHLIAAIHFRESGQSFKCHLHNGDPLTSKTTHVPAGRPLEGVPPFSWVDSAVDALTGRQAPQTWDVASCLEYAEKYNGLGYQKRSVNTPYVWDYTDKYTSGLYVADGSFDPNKCEDRPGVAAIFKCLESKGVVL